MYGLKKLADLMLNISSKINNDIYIFIIISI